MKPPLSFLTPSSVPPVFRALWPGLLLLVLMGVLGGGLSYLHLRVQAIAQQLRLLEEAASQRHTERLDGHITSVMDYLLFQRQRTETVARDVLKEKVDQIHAVTSALQAKLQALPPQEQQHLLIETLRPLRFLDGRGYFFIIDLKGNALLFPIQPHMEGENLWGLRDDAGHFIIQSLIEAVRNPEGMGFSRYRWYRPDHADQMNDKLSYVRHFAPFSWVIGAGEYLHAIEAGLQEEALDRIRALALDHNGQMAVLDREGRLLVPPGQAEPAENEIWARKVRQLMAKGQHVAELDYPHKGETRLQRVLIRENVQWGWTLVAVSNRDEEEGSALYDSAQAMDALRADWQVFVGLLVLVLALTLTAAGIGLRRLRSRVRQKEVRLRHYKDDLGMAQEAFETAPTPLMLLDENTHFILVNRAFLTQVGAAEAPLLLGKPFSCILGREEADWPSFHACIGPQSAWSGELWLRRFDGLLFPAHVRLSPVLALHTKGVYRIGTIEDVSLRKADEARLRDLHEFDPLTHLPNRDGIGLRLESALTMARQSKTPLALLMMDLDRFKTVNDSLGHSTGDTILSMLAARLSVLCQSHQVAARSGGDEFLILLEEGSREDAAQMACRILEAMQTPFHLAPYELALSASIGISLFPDDGEDVQTLMAHAEAAMYHAKENGRNTFAFFSRQMRLEVMERLLLEQNLHLALARHELSLVFQPQCTIEDGRLVGCEALLRWHHPEHGSISPVRFIPVAESTGLILPIGRWVLRQACEAARRWQDQGLGPIMVAVNVSPVQMSRGAVLAEVQAVLEETGLPPHLLEVELTESTLMEGVAHTLSLLQQLKALGVRLALDDFGTGWSSLAYLKRYRMDRLKIDRSFVTELPHNHEDAHITHAIIGVAQSLSMEVIAEGVENAEQAAFLLKEGCTLAQGYFYAKPMIEADFIAFAKAHPPRDVPAGSAHA